MFRFELGSLFQGQMRVAKLKSAYISLIIKKRFLLNHVSCPFPGDTSYIWPQMCPWSSFQNEVFLALLNSTICLHLITLALTQLLVPFVVGE